MATAEMEVTDVEEVTDVDGAEAPSGKKTRVKLDKATLGKTYTSVEEAKANPVKNVAGEVAETYRPYIIKDKSGTVKGYVNAKGDTEALGVFVTSIGYTAESTAPRGRTSEKGKPTAEQVAFGKMLIANNMPKNILDSFLATIPEQFRSEITG